MQAFRQLLQNGFRLAPMMLALCFGPTASAQLETRFVEKPHPSDVRLIDFEWLMPIRSYQPFSGMPPPAVKSMAVTLKKPSADHPDSLDFSKFETVRSVSTRDAKLLTRVTHVLIQSPEIRIPQKKKSDCKWLPFGELVINVGDQTVSIMMGDGFTERHEDCIKPDQVFFSAQLAEIVDEVLSEEFETGLTEREHQRLSGEWAFRLEQRAWADDEVSATDLRSAARTESKEIPTSKRLQTVDVNFQDFPGPISPPKWEHFTLDDDERLLSVTLTFEHTREFGPRAGKLHRWFDVTAVDAITLKRAARGLRTLMIRMPTVDHGGYAGIGPIGFIEFRTSKIRSMRLHIIPPMTIDKAATPKSFCNSWTLAKIINDMMLRETGTGLTAGEFSSLAGPFK